MRYLFAMVVVLSASAWVEAAPGILFAENFDTDVSANWQKSFAATDFSVDYQFDYSAVGIPEAPHSAGTTATTGMKMWANEFFQTVGGGSVSPIGLDLGTGDYVLTWDWWLNFHGPAPGGGSGTTQFSYAGILTSGTSPNFVGSTDSVFFGQTLDGGSAADWRTYTTIAPTSHQNDDQTNGIDVYAAPDDPATMGVDRRNATNPYYFDQVAGTGAFPGHTIPAAQTALFPGQQTGAAQDGITAFSWAAGKITKQGTVVTFQVNDLLISTIDLSDPAFVLNPTGGNNILFGHSDTNSFSSTDLLFSTLTFSLVDNIVVTVPEPGGLTLLGVVAAVLLRRQCD